MNLFLALALTLPSLAMGELVYDYSNPNVQWCTFNNSQCCSTIRQSPINIVTTSLQDQGTDTSNFPLYECPLGWSGDYFESQPGRWFNTGHTLEYEPTANDLILTGGPLGDKKYEFLQFHFHWGSEPCSGSEHTLNGVNYAAEVHLVHRNMNNNTDFAVVGFFLDVLSSSENSTWLDSLTNPAFDIRTENDTVNINHIVGQLFVEAPSLTNYAYYLGSLTTPLCLEVVNWIVMLEPVPIRDAQLEYFRATTGQNGINNSDNNRPVQDLQGRTVYRSMEP